MSVCVCVHVCGACEGVCVCVCVSVGTFPSVFPCPTYTLLIEYGRERWASIRNTDTLLFTLTRSSNAKTSLIKEY